jgi:hypothetical protein
MVMTVIIAAQKNVNGNSARLDQIQQGKVAMESMSKTLRTAVRPSQLNATCTGCDQAAFLQGNARSVQFYANINNPANILGPSRVSYTVDNSGVLRETLQAPNPHAANDYNYQYCTPGPGCTVISRVLARGVSLNKTMFTHPTTHSPRCLWLVQTCLAWTPLTSSSTFPVALKCRQQPSRNASPCLMLMQCNKRRCQRHDDSAIR